MRKLAAILAILLLTTLPAFATGPVVQSSVSAYCGGASNAQIKYAVVDDESSGDNTIITAVSSKRLRVLSYALVGAGAVNARFESGAGGTALTGVMTIAAAGGGIAMDCGALGCFETAAGALLNLELSGAVSVDGHVTYVECE